MERITGVFQLLREKGEEMKTILQKISVLFLCVVLTCSILPARAVAGFEIPGACQVQADSGASFTVKTLDCEYRNNTY